MSHLFWFLLSIMIPSAVIGGAATRLAFKHNSPTAGWVGFASSVVCVVTCAFMIGFGG